VGTIVDGEGSHQHPIPAGQPFELVDDSGQAFHDHNGNLKMGVLARVNIIHGPGTPVVMIPLPLPEITVGPDDIQIKFSE